MTDSLASREIAVTLEYQAKEERKASKEMRVVLDSPVLLEKKETGDMTDSRATQVPRETEDFLDCQDLPDSMESEVYQAKPDHPALLVSQDKAE